MTVTRHFDFPIERVFDAWLDPMRASKFLFASPTGRMVRADIDARVGGSFNFTDHRDGEDVEHVGTYVEIDRPRRLVFTFGVPKYSTQMTRVTLELKPSGAGCELTLTHEGVPPEWFDQTREGWGKILEVLSAFLGSKTQAHVSHRFTASAERVYDAWLDPSKVRVWMPPSLKSLGLAGDIRRVEIDARVSGSFFLSDQRGEIEAKHWGTYLVLERPRKIVFTWITDESGAADPSVVTLTIEQQSDGCAATIVHEMDRQWQDYVSRTEAGWGRMLESIASLL
jgi:uncharacterized protein YndB with AHSA1/START domain